MQVAHGEYVYNMHNGHTRLQALEITLTPYLFALPLVSLPCVKLILLAMEEDVQFRGLLQEPSLLYSLVRV